MATVLPFDPGRRRRPPDDVLTVAETAAMLGLSENTVYVHLADGSIPATRVGRRWIISAARLRAWLRDPESEAR